MVWLTGRPSRVRDLITNWLQANGLPYDHLLMQADDDYRPARVTKPERLAELGGPSAVTLLVDDDPRVIEAADELGYETFQADWCPWVPVTSSTRPT